MATRQKWEYLTVQTGFFGIVNINQLAAQFVNGSEIKDWKKVLFIHFSPTSEQRVGKCQVRSIAAQITTCFDTMPSVV